MQRRNDLLVTESTDMHQEHKAQMATAKKQVAMARQLVHEVCNNRTVRLILFERLQDLILDQRILRADAWGLGMLGEPVTGEFMERRWTVFVSNSTNDC
jgi:hypothetical protein